VRWRRKDVCGGFEVKYILDHSGQISLGLDILADTEVAGSFLEEWVLQTVSHHLISLSPHKQLYEWIGGGWNIP
jgi:hypothetical protein